MGERLIENEVKIWLPRDLERIKIQDDAGNKKTDIVVATITGLTTSWSVIENIKQFLGGVNGLTSSNPSNDIVGVKISNKEIRIRLFQGKSLYWNYSNLFRSRLYYSDLRCSCLIEIESEELKKASGGRSVVVLTDCFSLLNLIQSGGSLIDGWLVGRYMVKDYGIRSRGFRIDFTPYVSDSISVLIGEKLQSGKYVRNDNLVPGNLYSFSRRITSEYFIYLGKIGKNVLVTQSWYKKQTYRVFDVIGGNRWPPYSKLVQPSGLPKELHCFITVPNYNVINVIRTGGKDITKGGDLLAIFQNKEIVLAEDLRGIELVKTELVPETFNFYDESLALIAREITNNVNLKVSDLDKQAIGQVLALFPDVIWDTPELKEEFIECSAKICNVHWNTQQKLDDLSEKYRNHEIIGKHIAGDEVKEKFKKLYPNEGIC